MRNAPRVSTLIRKQLRARHIKDLPPIPPSYHLPLAIRLHKMRPNLLPTLNHLRQPVLASLGIVLPIHPPLPLDLQIALKIQQQIRTRHRPAREKMLRHPPALEIIRRALVRENMHKSLAGEFEGATDFGEEQFVVLHVLEEFDGDYAVVG